MNGSNIRRSGLSVHGSSGSGQQSTTRELLTSLFRDWRILATIFAIVLLPFLVAAAITTTTFTAQARLLVLFSREYLAHAELGAMPNIVPDQNQIVSNEMELFNSPLLIEKVIEDIGIDTLFPGLGKPSLLAEMFTAAGGIIDGVMSRLGLPPFRSDKRNANRAVIDRAIQRFIKELSIMPVKDANILSVTFIHPDAETAALAVNTLIRHYLDRRREIFSHDTAILLASERNRYADRLRQAQQELEAFKEKHQISAFDDQKSLTLRQQAELGNNRLTTETRLAEATARLTELRRFLSEVPKDVPIFTETGEIDADDNARAALLTLRLRRNELLTKFTESSRYVTDLDAQIEKVETQLKKTNLKSQGSKRLGRNTVYDQIEADTMRQETEVESLRQRLASLDQQRAEIEPRLAEFDHIEREYGNLLLNRNLLEENLKTYTQKVEEAQIFENMNRSRTTNIRMIENAEPPSVGNSTRMIIALFGFLAATLAAVLMLLVINHSRDIILTPEAAVRNLRLPVLVSIPDKNPAKRRQTPFLEEIGEFLGGLFRRTLARRFRFPWQGPGRESGGT